MANLSISNVVNVSVSAPSAGVGLFNTSNLALFTRETPASSFGTLGYQLYLSPTQVGVDFGTNSTTFAMANAVFSQQPNILGNNGYLVVMPMLTGAQTAVQSISFETIPTAGAFVLNYGVLVTSSLAFNATAGAIQTALRLLTGLTTVVVTGSIASGTLVVTFTGVSGPATLLTITSNTLVDADSNAVVPVVATTTIGSTAETFDAAIVRTQSIISYFGVMIAELTTQVVQLATAAVVQPLTKLAFFVSYNAADVQPGGMLDLLQSGGFSHSRGLFYGDVLATALVMMASYAGRALSVNFLGSNTTITMHLKDLAGVQPDPSMNQALLNLCQLAGADVYANFQGVPKVFISGANTFFDRIYNQLWYVGALQVSIFNYLAQSSTKIPQTESGMDGLKGAARQICEQAVSNQYLAPGTWTSSTTFGNQQDFVANISQRGYYIYSQPIGQQVPAARAARQAPLIQIAAKEAGAIHSATIIVYINE